MKVITYQAHNVLGVKDIQFDLAGHHLFLVGGKNAQGKTSALTALLMALCGKRGMDNYPEIALREGESKGWVRVDLTGDVELHDTEKFTVELYLRRKRTGTVIEEFRILDSTGAEAPEPRTLLQSLFNLKAFDPLAFERMKPKEQAELVQGMLGVDLKVFDEERAKVYEERKQVGVEGKKLAGKLALSKKHDGVPDKEENVAELVEELESRKRTNDMIYKIKASMLTYADMIKEYEQSIADSNKEIERLQQLIEAEKERIEHSKEEVASYQELTVTATKALENVKEQDEDEIRERIKNAESINRKVRANEEYKKLEAEVEKSRGEYQRCTDRLNQIDQDKADAIAKATWPVEGMELLEDGLLLNGRPFESASTSQRIMASIKVGMALNPKLKLLVCQHGSELDEETLEALDEVLRVNDFQMVVELVSRTKEDEDRCTVVIEDGEVKSSGGKVVTPRHKPESEEQEQEIVEQEE